MFQNKAFIVLGTNVGSWKNNFNRSFFEINKIGNITNFSSVYLSKPYGFIRQKYFYNTAVLLKTNLNHIQLLKELIVIEKKLQKKKQFINGPRKIDLDIIFFNKLIIRKNFLTVPHPRAYMRDFVLYPIHDIDPFYFHPVEKKTVKELIKNLKEKYILKKITRYKEHLTIF